MQSRVRSRNRALAHSLLDRHPGATVTELRALYAQLFTSRSAAFNSLSAASKTKPFPEVRSSTRRRHLHVRQPLTTAEKFETLEKFKDAMRRAAFRLSREHGTMLAQAGFPTAADLEIELNRLLQRHLDLFDKEKKYNGQPADLKRFAGTAFKYSVSELRRDAGRRVHNQSKERPDQGTQPYQPRKTSLNARAKEVLEQFPGTATRELMKFRPSHATPKGWMRSLVKVRIRMHGVQAAGTKSNSGRQDFSVIEEKLEGQNEASVFRRLQSSGLTAREASVVILRAQGFEAREVVRKLELTGRSERPASASHIGDLVRTGLEKLRNREKD